MKNKLKAEKSDKVKKEGPESVFGGDDDLLDDLDDDEDDFDAKMV